MWRIILALWLALAPAWADGISVPGVPRIGGDAAFSYPPSSGGGGATWNPQTSPACQVIGFTSSTATFTGVPMGTGVVVVGFSDDNNRAYSAVSINGNTATAAANTPGAGLFYASNTGSSGTVSVTGSGAFNVICMSIGYLTGVTATPTCAGSCPVLANSSPAQPISLGSSLTVSAGQIGIVFEGTNFGTGLPLSWTNATRDAATEVQNASGNAKNVGMAHLTTSGTPTFSCATSCSNAGTSMAAATWGP